MKTHINGNTIEQVLTNAVTLTQAQYDALPLEQKNHGTYIISDSTCPNINAEDVDYDSNTSVKDKIDTLTPKTVLSIPANTYSTMREALVALYNAYMTIPDEFKVNSKIVIRNQVIYTINDLTNKAFSYTVAQTVKTAIYSLYLASESSNCHYIIAENQPNVGLTITNNADSAQSYKIDLIY